MCVCVYVCVCVCVVFVSALVAGSMGSMGGSVYLEKEITMTSCTAVISYSTVLFMSYFSAHTKRLYG